MIVFGILMTERDPWIFSALVCYIMLCFGGGFATMPSFVLDVFGARKMSAVYGVMLTAGRRPRLRPPLHRHLNDQSHRRHHLLLPDWGADLGLGYVFSYLLSDNASDFSVQRGTRCVSTELRHRSAVCRIDIS